MIRLVPGLVLGVLAVYAASGRTLPLIGNGKGAFWLLAILGFAVHAAICTANVVPSGLPITLGVTLGLITLLLFGAVATGLRPGFLATDRQALVALAAIIAVKVTIATGSAAVTALRNR